MENIIELAIAYWRLDKWVANAPVEKKMAANSSLRIMKRYLDSKGIEIKDLTGQSFDYGMNLEVIHSDMPQGEDDRKAIISEMIKPMILQNGVVVSRGQVIIGLAVKTIENSFAQPSIPPEKQSNDNYKEGNKSNKKSALTIFDYLKEKVFKFVFLIIAITFVTISSINMFNISNSLKQNNDDIAQIINNKNTISIVFVYDDTNEVVAEETYLFGQEILIPDSITNRPADKTYTYNLSGWIKEPKNAEHNEIFRAIYNKTYIEYEVIFKNDDDSVISKSNYHYGDQVIVPDNPSKASDKEFTYTFIGWDKEIKDVSENITYTAKYSSTYIEYEVVFKNDDNSIISKSNYHYGDVVVVPTNPKKPDDDNDEYVFDRWDHEVSNVEKDDTYIAIYKLKEEEK